MPKMTTNRPYSYGEIVIVDLVDGESAFNPCGGGIPRYSAQIARHSPGIVESS